MQKAKRWHTWKRLDAGERLVGAECCAEHDRARLERTSINIYIYTYGMERWQKIRNVRVTIGCNSDWERSASAARSGPSTVSQYSAESERVRLLDIVSEMIHRREWEVGGFRSESVGVRPVHIYMCCMELRCRR